MNIARTPDEVLPAYTAASFPVIVPVPMLEEVVTFSATQVDTFRDCPTKWWMKSVLKVPTPQSPGAQFGSDCHTLRERWLAGGEMPQGYSHEANCARAGLEMLPLPGRVYVEIPLRMETQHGFVWTGKIDYFSPSMELMGDHRFRGSIPLVGDHKFMGKEIYVKTEEYLRNEDSQLGIYGTWAIGVTGASRAAFSWDNVVKDRPPRPIPVRFLASRDQIAENYAKVEKDALVMLQMRRARESLPLHEVPRNPHSCSKYGGCPMATIGCPITNNEKMGVLMTEQQGPGAFGAQLQAIAAQQPPQNGFQPPPMQQAAPAQQNGGFQPPPTQQGSFAAAMAQPPQQNGGFQPPQQQPPPQQFQQPPPQQPPPQQFQQQPPPQQFQQQAPAPTTQQFQPSPSPSPSAPAAPQSLAQLGQAIANGQAVVPPDAQNAVIGAPTPQEGGRPGRPRGSRGSGASKKTDGLSRRDAIAVKVYSTMIARGADLSNAPYVAQQSVLVTDALIAELDRSAR